jgi:hypothetical protein
MALLFRKINLQWFRERNACNMPALEMYFAKHGIDEIEISADGIMRAHMDGVLSSNWMARRILDAADLAEYECELNLAMRVFEDRMAPFLAKIVSRAERGEALTPIKSIE